MNEHSTEPEDVDSAMKDAPGKRDGNPSKPAEKSRGTNDSKGRSTQRNPDDVKDGSVQDGRQPLAGA